MRAVLAIIIVALLGYAGYVAWLREAEPPRSVEEAADRARAAAEEAVASAKEAVDATIMAAGPAAERASSVLQESAAELGEQARQLGHRAGEVASQVGNSARKAIGVAGERMRGAGGEQQARVEEGRELGIATQEAVGRARAALVGATDLQAAKDALPTLNEVNARLADLETRVEALPAEARNQAASLIADSLPALRDMGERTKQIEGVGPEIDAAINAMLGRLERWSQTSG
jgi:hypothetical protein